MSQIKELLKKIIPVEAAHFARKARFYGRRYYDPICRSHVRFLYPHGHHFPVLEEKKVISGGHRLNARCPICSSKDRDRLLYLYLTKRTDFFTKPRKLLHIAPENYLSRIIVKHPRIDYLTADINPGVGMVVMDITQIQYPDESFDAIICNHVMEHIPDDRLAMRELLRVLTPGGWAILQVPMSLVLKETFEDFSVAGEREREEVFGQKDHVRIYAMDYVDRLRESGFEITPFAWWEDAEFAGGQNENRYGLLPDEYLFMARKPSG